MLDAPIPHDWLALTETLELSYGTWALRHVFNSCRVLTSEQWLTVLRPLFTGVARDLVPNVCAAFREYLVSIGVLGSVSPDWQCSPGGLFGNLALPDRDGRSTRWRFTDPQCVTCGRPFTLFFRCHHCRTCEHSFCSAHARASNTYSGLPAGTLQCDHCERFCTVASAADVTVTAFAAFTGSEAVVLAGVSRTVLAPLL